MPLKNNAFNDTSTGIYISTGNNSFIDAQNTLLTLDGVSFLSGSCGFSDVYGSSVFCGYNSGNLANSGDHLTALGLNTLSNSLGSTKCTALGADALGQATISDRTLALGAQAGYNYTTESNCIAIANMGTVGDANLIRIGTPSISASLSISYIAGYNSGGSFGALADYTIDGFPYFATSQRGGDHTCDILKFDGSTITRVAYSDYTTAGWPSRFSWIHYQNEVFLAQSLVYNDEGPYVAVSQFTGTSLVESDTLVKSGNNIATAVRWMMVEGVAYLLVSEYFAPGASIYMFTGEKLVKVLDFSLSNNAISNVGWFSLDGITYVYLIDDSPKILIYTFNGSAVTHVIDYSFAGNIPMQPIIYKDKVFWSYWDTSTTVNIVSYDGTSFASATTFSSSDVRNPEWGYLNGEPILSYADSTGNIFIRQFTGTSSTQVFTQSFTSGESIQRAQIFEMDAVSYLALNGTSLGTSNNQTFAVYSITGTVAIPGHTSTYIVGIQSQTVTGSAVYVTTGDQLGVASSSERHKSDISDMSDMSQIIANLRPVTFTYNNDPEPKVRNYGLIAEEVEKVWPDMVGYKDGQPDNLYYQFLAPILLKEIQRQQKLIIDLSSRLSVLEGKV